jgi:hypothetical protein
VISESVYEQAVEFRHAGACFGDASPIEVFARLTVYIEFTESESARQMTQSVVPGQSGLWVAAYSSLRRLQLARGNDEIEYSATRGEWVLSDKPVSAGVWFDPCFLGGRAILLPEPDIEWGS